MAHLPQRPAPRRALCARCLRPAAACICSAVRPVPTAVQVLILMHPLERQQAKGTARLLHLCLERSRLVVGETFAAGELDRLLTGPWEAAEARLPRRPVLLYPSTPGIPTAAPGDHPVPGTVRDAAWRETEPDRLRLVVLDGTWRKSRKMLWNNPALQQLPRLSLRGAPPSRYAIRKAHAPHQLSTLEAVQHALGELEPENHAPSALGEALQVFIALQQRHGFGARPAMLDAPNP